MIKIVLSIFCATLLFALFPPPTQSRRKLLFIVLGIVMICVAGLKIENSDQDYATYVKMYKHINDDVNILTEPSFEWIAKLSSTSLMMFVIYAILSVSLKFVAIKQLTELWFLSVMIYCSYFFLLHDFTQIRVAVSSGFLLLCIKPIYERDWKRFFIYSGIAILFHYSAIIILPLWVLGSKPRIMILALSVPFAYLIYFSGINIIATIPIPYLQTKLAIYQKMQELGDDKWSVINVFNLVFLAKITIFYLLILKYKLIALQNKYVPILMKIQAVSIISFPIFAKMPILGFRISELFGIVEVITIPLIYYVLVPRFFSKLVVCGIGFILIIISIFNIKLVV